jgi:hypothetical protein
MYLKEIIIIRRKTGDFRARNFYILITQHIGGLRVVTHILNGKGSKNR